MLRLYVIRNKTPEETLFWSNYQGWVDDKELATTFYKEETLILQLPIGEPDEKIEWIALDNI